MITDRREFTTKITLYGVYSFHFSVGINLKSFPWHLHSIQETSPNFLRRPTWVDNTADNADIVQSQTANHHRLLSHVTIGLVECMKQTACAQIAKRFAPNTVLWAFHTIQPSYSFQFKSAFQSQCRNMFSQFHDFHMPNNRLHPYRDSCLPVTLTSTLNYVLDHPIWPR